MLITVSFDGCYVVHRIVLSSFTACCYRIHDIVYTIKLPIADWKEKFFRKSIGLRFVAVGGGLLAAVV